MIFRFVYRNRDGGGGVGGGGTAVAFGGGGTAAAFGGGEGGGGGGLGGGGGVTKRLGMRVSWHRPFIVFMTTLQTDSLGQPQPR